MRNRTLLETLRLAKDINLKEIIRALWRDRAAKVAPILQPAHGFLVGNVIKPSATIWVKAQANSEANAKATAVVSEVIDVDHFVYVQEGVVPGPYLKGAKYFLSIATAGEVFAQADPEVWQIDQYRQMIGTGTDGGLMVEIDEGALWKVYIGDVPDDGKKYVRKYKAWLEYLVVDGLTPTIGGNGNWWIGTIDTGIKAAGTNGTNGRGITSIALTNTVGNIKTYTITFTDAITFNFNVADGAPGPGVAPGGTTNQKLVKNSNTDFDTKWVDDAVLIKTSGAEVTTGTDDAKYLTPKSVTDSNIVQSSGVKLIVPITKTAHEALMTAGTTVPTTLYLYIG